MRDDRDSEKTRTHGSFPSPDSASVGPPRRDNGRLGPYQLLERVGIGEFGEVYRAKIAESPEQYAIKIFKPSYGGSHWRSFTHEARLLQKLHHRGLPKCVATGIARSHEAFAGRPYLIMEFIAGQTLRQRLQAGMELDTKLRWAYQLVEAVHYLHSQGIIHRDLKPGNIMITDRGLKVLDFGIAILREQRGQEVTGSLRYMSPEQLAGQKLTTASDIYSLGLILCELLNDNYPYQTGEPSSLEEWQDIHRQAPMPFTNPAVPVLIAEIVLQCLNKEGENRPDAGMILSMLEQEIAGTGSVSYIGIVGSKGSGKSCYMVSLYLDAQGKTRDILEDRYVALYEKQELPSPTELSADQLHFGITDANSGRFYKIITKDYGGELLEGRRENIERMTELLKEKRADIYEFFQAASAIILLVETNPGEEGIEAVLKYRREILFLLEQIAVEREGRRKIEVPVALVLSKWDRMGDISRDLQREKERALQYIQQTEYLAGLCDMLKTWCAHFEVFPIFSFIGDKPTGGIQPFNLYAPLIWAAEQGEWCLWEKCRQFHVEHPDEYYEILENCHRLYIEKVEHPKIVAEVQSLIEQSGQQYLEFLEKQAMQKDVPLTTIIRGYRRFLEARCIGEKRREYARQRLSHYEKKLAGRKRFSLIVGILAFLGLLYSVWEFWSDYRVRQTIIRFEQGRLPVQEFLLQLEAYRKYRPIGLLRRYRDPKISADAKKAMEAYMQRKEKEAFEGREQLYAQKDEMVQKGIWQEVNWDWQKISEELPRAREKIAHLTLYEKRLQEYLVSFPDSPFREEIAQWQQECSSYILSYNREITIMFQVQKLIEDCNKLEDFARKNLLGENTLEPKGEDTPFIRDMKREKIQQMLALSRNVQERLRTLALPHLRDRVREWDERCTSVITRLQTLEQRYQDLQVWGNECQAWQGEWQKKIFDWQSYDRVYQELQKLREKMPPGVMSNNIQMLDDLQRQVLSIRTKDRLHYKDIEESIRRCDFLGAFQEIDSYMTTSEHHHVMSTELSRFLGEFNLEIVITISLDPAKYQGEKNPDFFISVEYRDQKQKFYQEDMSGKTEMGKVKTYFNCVSVRHNQMIYVHIKEADLVEDDDHGTWERDLKCLLRNDTLVTQFPFGSDGAIEMEFKPEFHLYAKLPEFR